MAFTSWGCGEVHGEWGALNDPLFTKHSVPTLHLICLAYIKTWSVNEKKQSHFINDLFESWYKIVKQIYHGKYTTSGNGKYIVWRLYVNLMFDIDSTTN